jgi:hypothetical protein
MGKITRDNLLPPESYIQQRPQLREAVVAHKKRRSLHLGDHLTVLFEDEQTIRYQIQEMLRIERITQPAAIEEEIAAYAPLVPEGDNWKATLLIEYADINERRAALVRLRGIEHCLWVTVEGYNRVYAVADEDLDRTNDQKTSAVHFLRYPLGEARVAALRKGASVSFGCDHPDYPVNIVAPQSLREALCEDFL